MFIGNLDGMAGRLLQGSIVAKQLGSKTHRIAHFQASVMMVASSRFRVLATFLVILDRLLHRLADLNGLGKVHYCV